MEIIKLNLIPSGVNPTCHCSQYDNGRVIRIELFDGLTPYTLQSGDTVTLNVRKPDNHIVTTTLTATQGNKFVDLVTTEQICACVGYNLCDLTITNGSTVIGTLNFIMQVERDVLADGIPSQSVIEDLDELVAEAVGDNYYNKTETDSLLDGKADKSNTYNTTEIDSALALKANKTELDNLKDLTTQTVTSWDNITLTIQNGYYYYINGNFYADSARRCSKINVNAGEKYKITTFTRPISISGIIYFNSSDAVIGHDLDGTGTSAYHTDYEFTIPTNCTSVAVQSADANAPVLKKLVESVEFKAYSKSESDARFGNSPRYGVKWQISNPDDLGQRCFNAEGLSATIGQGSTNGSSDFDNIYPWSEIKRCNISKNANGAEIVTFEGESGFALDGSNGDVFVRIPKFYYQRYIKDGYEYRIISESGSNVHPCFIENGKELDEIFISAFEGYIDNNKLRSIGGVLPTSNIVAQDFLNVAQANGSNYSLYDNRCVDAVFALMAVEFGCRNSNQILGYGLANFEQPTNAIAKNVITTNATNTNTVRTAKWTASNKTTMPIGSNITVCDTDQFTILTQAKLTACVDGADYTDWTFDGSPIDVDTNCFIGSAAFNTNWCENAPSGSLSWHTGRTEWIIGEQLKTQNAIRYRWIENIFGNLWHFLPDVTFNALQMYVCNNMADYEMHKITTPYKPQSKVFVENNDNGSKADIVNANYWITDLDSNVFEKGIDFGRSYDKSLTSDKAFGAYYYLANYKTIIANGGGFDHLYRCNILTQRAWVNSTQKWHLYGARLMYKHLT